MVPLRNPHPRAVCPEQMHLTGEDLLKEAVVPAGPLALADNAPLRELLPDQVQHNLAQQPQILHGVVYADATASVQCTDS
jgi:hypothetical protein